MFRGCCILFLLSQLRPPLFFPLSDSLFFLTPLRPVASSFSESLAFSPSPASSSMSQTGSTFQAIIGGQFSYGYVVDPSPHPPSIVTNPLFPSRALLLPATGLLESSRKCNSLFSPSPTVAFFFLRTRYLVLSSSFMFFVLPSSWRWRLN